MPCCTDSVHLFFLHCSKCQLTTRCLCDGIFLGDGKPKSIRHARLSTAICDGRIGSRYSKYKGISFQQSIEQQKEKLCLQIPDPPNPMKSWSTCQYLCLFLRKYFKDSSFHRPPQRDCKYPPVLDALRALHKWAPYEARWKSEKYKEFSHSVAVLLFRGCWCVFHGLLYFGWHSRTLIVGVPAESSQPWSLSIQTRKVIPSSWW